MGWTGLYTDRPTREILLDELTFADKTGSARIVKMSTKLHTTYIAWERSYAAGTKSMYAGKTFIMGLVVLHRRKGGEFIYKTVSEDMGPCEKACPAAILDLLSPVEAFADPTTSAYEWATNWRAVCRLAIEKRNKAPGDGVTIRFKEPIRFTTGETLDTFTIHKRGRKVRFAPPGGTYSSYCISNWQERDYEICEKDTVSA